jgi:hypothetical protein
MSALSIRLFPQIRDSVRDFRWLGIDSFVLWIFENVSRRQDKENSW